jgi:hypothetical protein
MSERYRTRKALTAQALAGGCLGGIILAASAITCGFLLAVIW